MSPNASMSRRAALASLAASALMGLGGCAPTSAPAVQAAAQPTSGFRISSIEVDTSGLLAQSGNPTRNGRKRRFRRRSRRSSRDPWRRETLEARR